MSIRQKCIQSSTKWDYDFLQFWDASGKYARTLMASLALNDRGLKWKSLRPRSQFSSNGSPPAPKARRGAARLQEQRDAYRRQHSDIESVKLRSTLLTGRIQVHPVAQINMFSVTEMHMLSVMQRLVIESNTHWAYILNGKRTKSPGHNPLRTKSPWTKSARTESPC